MSKKIRSRKKKYDEDIDFHSDETFFFIAGHTSSGFPYGVTWEQFNEEDFIENCEQLRNMKKKEELDDEIPF